MNVLIIEDCAEDARVTCDALQEWEPGAVCEVVATHDAALAAIAQQRFALIILDLSLVDTNGLMTVVPILLAARPSGTPVLIFTGTDPTMPPQVMQAGAGAFIGKHASRDTLSGALTELFGARA